MTAYTSFLHLTVQVLATSRKHVKMRQQELSPLVQQCSTVLAAKIVTKARNSSTNLPRAFRLVGSVVTTSTIPTTGKIDILPQSLKDTYTVIESVTVEDALNAPMSMDIGLPLGEGI